MKWIHKTTILLFALLCTSLTAAGDFDKKLGKVLKNGGLNVDERHNGHNGVTVPLKSKNRSHLVYVSSNLEEVSGYKIREIWAIVAQSDSTFDYNILKSLLDDASTRLIGSWKLMSINNKETIVLYSKVPSYTKEHDLFVTIGAIAGASDNVEAELTSADEF